MTSDPVNRDQRKNSAADMSKIRIDNIGPDTSPQAICDDLLETLSEISEVSIHSGQNLIYALVDVPYKEAEEAVEYLHGRSWRGKQVAIHFANRVRGGTWLPGHDWKPPRRERW